MRWMIDIVMVIGGRYTLRWGESGRSRLAAARVAGDLLMAPLVRCPEPRWKAAFAAFMYDFGQPFSNALFAPRQSRKIVLETSFSLTKGWLGLQSIRGLWPKPARYRCSAAYLVQSSAVLRFE